MGATAVAVAHVAKMKALSFSFWFINLEMNKWTSFMVP